MMANATCCKNNNQSSNNNGSAKLYLHKNSEKCSGKKKHPAALPEVHPMVIVTVPPFPSN